MSRPLLRRFCDTAPQSAATPDYLYKIGPLDSVNVVVWRNPELTNSVPVRPDGKITAPLIEDLPALGKDPTTLARDIGLLMAHGWVLSGLRAFDAFPMTHHVECVATLLRDPA